MFSISKQYDAITMGNLSATMLVHSVIGVVVKGLHSLICNNKGRAILCAGCVEI